MYKSVDDLVIEDFRSNPIWHPIDDFEDSDMMVEPFVGTTLNMEEIYLVAAKVTLADGSEYEGYVRFSWGTPVAITLSIYDREFISFPAKRLTADEDWRLEFLKALNKKEDDVFPFAFQISIDIRLEGTVY
jgi:hypothetical protein